MTLEDKISNTYFDWILDIVCGDDISYKKLLTQLHNTKFRYSIEKDANRAEDGIDLRYRFAYMNGYGDLSDFLEGPCSILEMMVALAIRCEETIMDDPKYGDRTRQWFWGMITNLGLGGMTDNNFDKIFVQDTINRFLDRDYAPDGKGGLFRVRGCERDLRDYEIWYQLCWYIDTIV